MSGQKFIGRNRAPRVQIEYDVELYGAQKKVQLPFVMGVMSNLSGQPDTPPRPISERSFVDVSVDNFDDFLRGTRPRLAIQVANKLTGEGNLNVELRFEKLEHFEPGAIAQHVPALAKLLEARTQLANLITYMDGKSGAEELIARVLGDPGLLNALAAAPAPDAQAKPAAETPGAPKEG